MSKIVDTVSFSGKIKLPHGMTPDQAITLVSNRLNFLDSKGMVTGKEGKIAKLKIKPK